MNAVYCRYSVYQLVEHFTVSYSVYQNEELLKPHLPLSGWFRIISFLWASLILFLLAVGLKEGTVVPQ